MRIEIEPDVRLFVDIEGAAFVPEGPRLRKKPTLVLLHGGPGYDHSGFKPAFSCLADLVQIVYVDHRGHGRSDRRPAVEWTLDTFADDVVRLCDALGIVKPIVLGQSFGGFVAQRYLARHPAHPARVPGDQHHAVGMGAVRPGYAERCRSSQARGDAVDHRDLDAGRAQMLHLLAAAPEHEGVAALQPHHAFAAPPPQWVRFERFANAGHGAWRDDPGAGFAVLRGFIEAPAVD